MPRSQSPLALEAAGCPRRRRRVGQPRRHERGPASIRPFCLRHAPTVAESTKELTFRGRQGDDHCYRLGDDGTGAARGGPRRGPSAGRGPWACFASTTTTRRRRGTSFFALFVRLDVSLPRRGGVLGVRVDLPNRRMPADVEGYSFVEKVQMPILVALGVRIGITSLTAALDVLPGARIMLAERRRPVFLSGAGGRLGGHVRVTPQRRNRSPSSLRTAGSSSPFCPHRDPRRMRRR